MIDVEIFSLGSLAGATKNLQVKVGDTRVIGNAVYQIAQVGRKDERGWIQLTFAPANNQCRACHERTRNDRK